MQLNICIIDNSGFFPDMFDSLTAKCFNFVYATHYFREYETRPTKSTSLGHVVTRNFEHL